MKKADAHHSAQGKAIADGFAQGDYVWHNLLLLKSPEVIPRAAEPALHLISNAHRALRPHLLVHLPQIPLRQNDLRMARMRI